MCVNNSHRHIALLLAQALEEAFRGGAQGIDLRAGGRVKNKNREAPVRQDVYLRLLVKVRPRCPNAREHPEERPMANPKYVTVKCDVKSLFDSGLKSDLLKAMEGKVVAKSAYVGRFRGGQ